MDNQTWFDATLVKRFNDCNREVSIHSPNVSTLLSSVFIRGGNSSSGVEARNEGTRQKCRNVGSMNCNFLITIIKSLNQNSIKPCLIIMFVSVKCYSREHFLTPIIREVNFSQELSWKYLPVYACCKFPDFPDRIDNSIQLQTLLYYRDPNKVNLVNGFLCIVSSSCLTKVLLCYRLV